MELLKSPKAFSLLTQIALRAKRTPKFNIQGLTVGEALVGDHRNYGMTRQEYRTALGQLKKWGFITIKTTNKGTIVKITDNSVYDINEETQQPSKQPLSNHQATTNKNDKNDKNIKKESYNNETSKINRVFTRESKIGETIET